MTPKTRKEALQAAGVVAMMVAAVILIVLAFRFGGKIWPEHQHQTSVLSSQL